jgi:hypothetical protein
MGLKFVPFRRLEDKIRHLCVLAREAKDGDARLILSELRILLRQHIEHLRMVAAGKLSGTREFIERRSDGPPELKKVENNPLLPSGAE